MGGSSGGGDGRVWEGRGVGVCGMDFFVHDYRRVQDLSLTIYCWEMAIFTGTGKLLSV